MSTFSVCFVCLGNICRSPTAEGVFRSVLATLGREHQFTVDSAGTAGWHAGALADKRARAAAKKRGYELNSRARQVTQDDLERFDLVVAMDKGNLRALRDLAPTTATAAKVRLLRSFEPAGTDEEVPDPYYGEEDGFEAVLDMCEHAAMGIVEFLDAQRDGSNS
jgi:protein-tyrosine phosphatase